MSDSQVQVQEDFSTISVSTIPVGCIVPYAGISLPKGWLLCDGSFYERCQYPDLYEVLGSNNPDHFQLPDLRDKFIVAAGNKYKIGDRGGSDTVTLTLEQMPEHRHDVLDQGHNHEYEDWHAGYRNKQYDSGSDMSSNFGGQDNQRTTAPATTGISICEAGGNQPHENRPPYYALSFIIKA